MSAGENASHMIYRHVAGLEQKISLLESQKSALLEALKPFAKLLADHHGRLSDNTPIYGVMENTITVGDIRQANAALRAAGVL